MFEYITGPIGAAGLCLEIVGLGFLFTDLILSKRKDHTVGLVNAFNESLAGGLIEHQIETVRSLRKAFHATSMALVFSDDQVLERSAREALALAYSDAAESMPTDEELNKQTAKFLVGVSGAVQTAKNLTEEHNRLRRVAMTGIFIVLLGAAIQLSDLLFI